VQQQFDVVIIGSGAGGAPIANTLVKAGKSVLVLEKGPLFVPQSNSENGRSDFKRDELISDGMEKIVDVAGVANNGISYYSSHVEPDLNDEPHIYKDTDGKDRATIEGYTAQLVGGGTNLYGGVHFRFSELDFRLQTFNAGRTDLQADPNHEVADAARDWPISYADLEPYYTKTEELIGINGTSANQQKPFSRDVYQTPLAPNAISETARVGMVKLADQVANGKMPIQPYRTPLAVITEDHAPSGRKVPANSDLIKTSYVNRYGDAMGYKSSVWVSLLAPIKDQPNFLLRPNCVVTRLTYSGGKVDKVYFLDPSGQELWAQGKVVVVACSAIESIRLLKLSATLDSGFDKAIHHNDLLGRYFMTHCFGGASAVLADSARSDKSKSLDADWATDCCATEDFLRSHGLWAGGALYNNTSDEALPLSMLRTKDALDLDNLWVGFANDLSLRGDSLLQYFDENFGRGLSVSFMANQVPQYNNRIDLHPTATDKWNRPVAYIEKTWHSHDMYLMNTYADRAADILNLGGAGTPCKFLGKGGSYMAPNGIVRIANHILGGARMGNDPKDSVLDSTCRAWAVDNLYVTDGAFMPTSGSGNPTNTIEANSFRVADAILKRV
jgi:choline dehydrogenase-like flavoprotein